MSFVNLISLLLFIAFFSSYIAKLIIMKRKAGIKALVLAKGNKGSSIKFTEVLVKITTFLWAFIWLLESLFNNWMIDFLPNLFTSTVLVYFGLMFIFIGFIFFVSSMITMKNSWRVGIDKATKTQLITNGLYKYSRNPAFLGFYLMFFGVVLTFPNIVTLLICIVNIISMHNLILQEEKHLVEIFKEDYHNYKRITPRYLFF